MGQILTVSCKLEASPDQSLKLDATLQAFADACNYVNQETPHGLKNQIALQALIYQAVRNEFGLSANLTIQAIRRVANTRLAGHVPKKFLPTSASYDQRIFAFRGRDWTVSLTLLDGRERFGLSIGNYQRSLLKEQNPTSATLVKRKDGTYYIHIQVKSDAPGTIEPKGTLGVDLGRRDIAVTSEGDTFSGEQVTKTRDHYAKQRASLQRKAAKGTRSTRRRCRQLQKRLSGRESRFQRHVNHETSRRIVDAAMDSDSAIVLEDLGGIRESTNSQPRTKVERRRSNSWAFYQLRLFIAYKAMAAGIPILIVPPAYTSQTCCSCLHIGSRSAKSFSCPHCGWSGDADLNGSRIIALLGAAVIRPEGSSLYCEVQAQGY